MFKDSFVDGMGGVICQRGDSFFLQATLREERSETDPSRYMGALPPRKELRSNKTTRREKREEPPENYNLIQTPAEKIFV